MSEKWAPDEREEDLIAAWFEDMDESSQAQVGGAKIAKFLMESGIDKGILRHIWEIVDTEQRGVVNLVQFTLIIRLVSLAASPRFHGQAPSMQMYAETVTDRIPLPHSLIEACEATKELNKEIARERSSSMDNNSSANRRPSGGESPRGDLRRNSGGKMSPTRRRSSGSNEKISPSARRRSSGSKHTKAPAELEWLPSIEEEQKLAQWFAGLDTDPQNGQVGGAKIVKFLMESGLEKGVLRGIWELVDTERRGWVDKVQFMLIMRLVSIAYSGQEPSMEKYKATINNTYSYPLPPLTLSVVTPASTHGASSLGPMMNDTHTVASASAASTPVPAAASAVTTPMGTLLSPGGQALFMSPVSASTPREWIPTPAEAATLDAWYSSLDEKQLQQVGGAKIVGFLLKSGLPKSALRDIWAVGDTGAKGWVSKQEFVLIVRLVAVCLYRGVTEPSMEAYIASIADTSLPLPPLGDVLATSPPSPSMWHPDLAEAATITSWFNSLAAGSDTITGATIVPFLMKSGVPKAALREIWELGDKEKRGCITKEQFTLMVRLVCLSLAGLARGENGMPSMEAYYATISDSLPLPALAQEEEDFSGFQSASEANTSGGGAQSNLAAVFGSVQEDSSYRGGVTQGVSGDENAFGDFGGAAGVTTGATTTVVEADEDDFGDFDKAVAAEPAPAPAPAPAPVRMPMGDASGAANGDKSAAAGMGLGNELGLTISTSSSSGDTDGPSVSIPTSNSLSSSIGLANTDSNSSITDDFGDFGVGVAPVTAPTPAVPDATPAVAMNMTLGDSGTGSGTGLGTGSWDAFDALSGNSVDNANVSLSAPTEPTVQSGVVPSLSRDSKGDILSPEGGFRDSFDMGVPPPPVPAFAPQSPTGTASRYSSEKPSAKRQGLLSPSELEALSNKLKDSHQFEFAFMAARQRVGLLRLDEIAEEKAIAVDNDDLERAVLCKRRSLAIIEDFYTAGMERRWVRVAESTHEASSLLESIEILEDLDRIASLRCRQAFLGGGRLLTGSPLDEARFCASAKRTLRLLIAVHTTHHGVAEAWSGLMRSIVTRLRDCKLMQLVKYQALSNVDKVAVKDHDDMATYIAGMVKITELGLHVATTVLECGVTAGLTEADMDMARTMESLGHGLLLSVRQEWAAPTSLLELGDPLSEQQLEENREGDPVGSLKLAAITCPPNTSATTNSDVEDIAEILYCNLTLRPLACRLPNGHIRSLWTMKRGFNTAISSSVDGIVAVDTPGLGKVYYMKSAVDYYLHEVDDTLPALSGAFVVA